MHLRKEARLFRQERIRLAIIANPGLTAAEIAARFSIRSEAVNRVATKYGLQTATGLFLNAEDVQKLVTQDNHSWGSLGVGSRRE